MREREPVCCSRGGRGGDDASLELEPRRAVGYKLIWHACWVWLEGGLILARRLRPPSPPGARRDLRCARDI